MTEKRAGHALLNNQRIPYIVPENVPILPELIIQ
jgi:hypothetical protein